MNNNYYITKQWNEYYEGSNHANSSRISDMLGSIEEANEYIKKWIQDEMNLEIFGMLLDYDMTDEEKDSERDYITDCYAFPSNNIAINEPFTYYIDTDETRSIMIMKCL